MTSIFLSAMDNDAFSIEAIISYQWMTLRNEELHARSQKRALHQFLRIVLGYAPAHKEGTAVAGRRQRNESRRLHNPIWRKTYRLPHCSPKRLSGRRNPRPFTAGALALQAQRNKTSLHQGRLVLHFFLKQWGQRMLLCRDGLRFRLQDTPSDLPLRRGPCMNRTRDSSAADASWLHAWLHAARPPSAS